MFKVLVYFIYNYNVEVKFVVNFSVGLLLFFV